MIISGHLERYKTFDLRRKQQEQQEQQEELVDLAV